MMACNWANLDYFTQLLGEDQRAHTALEMLVDDLHTDKEHTISTFLSHSGSEDFLWGLVRLLGNISPRVAGNAAYILGTLAESELGCSRILSLAKGRHNKESKKILNDLTRMLTFDDPESVMNAAGTLGTLAESLEGREWMLSEPCIDDMLDHVAALLGADNLWTASNAALVLARLCISEGGCLSILKHSHSQTILTRVIQALGVDEAGRGMNAAFAIGRLCDMDSGRQRLLQLPDCNKMISSLSKMLSCEDTGASKNACFALSCLAASLEGHGRLLSNANSDNVVKTLARLLMAEDCETGWFAAMTLRTLASQPKGCLKLREFPQVQSALKKIEQLPDVNPDLKDEVLITLEILKHLDPPEAPTITVLGPNLCEASWMPVSTKSGFDVRYQLYEGNNCCYTGPSCQFEVKTLTPHTTYNFKIRAITDVDESPFSEATTVTTEEDIPEAPQNVCVLGATATQLKVGWDPPVKFHGIPKGYYVYQGKTMVTHTTELTAIVSGLTPSTSYEVEVCAATFKGKGPRSSCTGTTADMGAHVPGKPVVQVLGRNEMHVSWDAPQVPMGRITRYDVSMNGQIFYSGTELTCSAHRLTPDTDYTFIVTAITSEGRFDSKSTKKRTAKDEFDLNRAPLYQPKKKEEEPQKPTLHKKRRSDTKSARARSAKANHERPISAASSYKSPQTQSTDQSPPQPPRPTRKLETKKENIRPRTHKDNTQTTKPPAPVTISYISILGGDDDNLEFSSLAQDFPSKAFFRSPTFHQRPIQSFRFERSKTTIIPSKSCSNKTVQTRRSDFNFNLIINGDIPPLLASDPVLSFSGQALQSGGQSSTSEKTPEQQKSYIGVDQSDGSRRFSATSDASSQSKSYTSTRSSVDLGPNANVEEEQNNIAERRKDDDASASSLMFYTRSRTPADSSFIEAQKMFIQRTNTFVNSQRPGRKKIDINNIPINLLESTSLMIQDRKLMPQRANSKFIPLQLRAQPSNLTVNQLQRLNTTLPQTSRGLSKRQLGGMSRSYTQINMRSRPQSNQMPAHHSDYYMKTQGSSESPH